MEMMKFKTFVWFVFLDFSRNQSELFFPCLDAKKINLSLLESKLMLGMLSNWPRVSRKGKGIRLLAVVCH